MALDEFITEKEYPIGSIKSRKKVENITLDKDKWRFFVAHAPEWPESWANDMERSEVKAIVKLMDSIIEEGLDGVALSDDELDKLEDTRDNIVQEHIAE
jgi:hypothetical protein